jgi:Sulfotransferase family
MICHRWKTLFIHIPKTGGQSVEQVFLDRMRLSWASRGPLLLTTNHNPEAGPPFLAHLTAEEFLSNGHLAPIDFDDYFRFTIVRNPWDRAVSEYKYRYANEMGFRDFMLTAYPAPIGSNEERHLLPQWSFVHDQSGQCLVDQLIRFEHIERDFAAVSSRIFGEPVVLPRVNTSPDRRDYREFYDAETRELIAHRYRRDIAWLGYEF